MIDDLRQAFAADDRGPVDEGRACPAPEEIWEAVHARLDRERTRLLVDHVAACPSCAADWRLALRGERLPGSTAGADRRRAWRWAPYVGAAAVLVGLGWALFLGLRTSPEPSPAFRDTAPGAIRSLLSEDEPLSREAAVLRWTPLDGDVRYSVIVSLPDLSPVAVGRELEKPEFEIPAAALRELPPGQTIVWRVEARFVAGGQRESGAFLGRIDE